MAVNPIVDAHADTHRLERLYRSDPAAFISHLDQALQMHPRSPILKFWQARFDYSEPGNALSVQIAAKQILYPILLCVVATLLVRTPSILPVDEVWFYSRFAPLIVISSLIFYYTNQSPHVNSVTIAILIGTAVTSLTMFLLPNNYQSSSVVMSIIHAPLVMWSLLGLAFTSRDWRNTNKRIEYLRYNGEVFIYTTLILLGGIVLTGLTIGLFGLIDLDIEDWYVGNVVVAGLVSAPILATFLFDEVLHRKSRFATTIANIFTPLFLMTVIIYLVAMTIEQSSPYSDRDFLILFNGLLLLVLGMTVFSVCGRNHDRPSSLVDLVNLGLVCVTLIVNVVALSAILYRFSEWGMSPNRVVVLGANVLIFVHLIQILRAYVRIFWRKADAEKLIKATVGFLPVYGVWALVVVVVLPIMFGFE